MNDQVPRTGRRWGRIVVFGCAGLIVVGLALAGTIMALVMGGIKSSDVFRQAMTVAQANPGAVAALGEPIKAGFFVSGSINVSGPTGEAGLSIPVRGSTGEGTLYLDAARDAGAWNFNTLSLDVEGGEMIDLLAEAADVQQLAANPAYVEESPGTEAAPTYPGAISTASTAELGAALDELTGPPPASVTVDPRMMIWVARQYNGWENPLYTEVAINGTTVNVFTSDTFLPIANTLRPGWNTVSLTTTPQEPASSANGLIFRLGPVERNERGDMVMSPVIWTFHNYTDWSLENGHYSHSLGPTVEQVTLTYHLFYAGLEYEGRELAEGDYVLQGAPQYGGWDTPVTATIMVNGTVLNTFVIESRQLVVNDLLLPGRNEIRILSQTVENSVSGNDVQVSLGGPALWNVGQQRFLLNPIAKVAAMTGWTKDPQTLRLTQLGRAESRVLVRSVPFFMEAAPGPD